MARHAKKPQVTDNGATPSGKKRKSSRVKPEEEDNEEFKEETTPKRTKKSPVKKSEASEDESFEEDVAEEDYEPDDETSPSKKKRVSFSPLKDSDDHESAKGRPKKGKAKAKTTEDKEDNYEVEAIVGDRIIKGHVQYKVRWKGYSSDDDTWEDEDNLNCAELIEEYNDAKSDDEAKVGTKEKEHGSSDESETDDGPTKKKKNEDGGSTKRSTPKVKTESKKSPPTGGNPGPMPDGEYKVSKIIDMHTLKNGKREFLIRWQGWSEKDDTWEPESNLVGNDKLEKFLERLEKVKQVDMKELRVKRKATDHFSAAQHSKTLAVEGRVRGSKRFQNKGRKCYFETD